MLGCPCGGLSLFPSGFLRGVFRRSTPRTFKKMDLSKYQFGKEKLPPTRYQELVLEAVKEFKIDPKGKGMIWGRIGLAKKNKSYPMIEQKIQFAITETRELSPKNPGRYFVKLIFKYL